MTIDRDQLEEQAMSALEEAKNSDSPHDKLAWLQVASAWASIAEHLDGPDQPPIPNGFVHSLPSSPDEVTRITIRLAENGNAIVICDPKFKAPVSARAQTPAEAASLAMTLLDLVQDAPE